jgi:tetratricopeptide (TPR) repeat protein
VAESSTRGRRSGIRPWLVALALLGCLPVAGVDGAWAQGTGNGSASPESKGSNREQEVQKFERLVEQANKLEEQEKLQEASAAWENIVRLSEKIYGGDHPDTATSLNTLGLLYFDQAHYQKAEPLYTRALAIRRKILGQDHPDTLVSLGTLWKTNPVHGRIGL